MQSTALTRLDSLISRILFVRPQPAVTATDETVSARTAERTFNFSLMLSAVRCVIKYVLLPFILPIVGIAGGLATGISLAINAVAIVSIIFSVRRLWQMNYSRKWAYLGVAVVTLVFIGFFILFDLKIIS
jgi:hypothetical protein